MNSVDRAEAEALCATVAERLGFGGPAELVAWVREWAAVHDPDADVTDATAGLPLDGAVTDLLRRSSICRTVAPYRSVYDEVVVLGASARGMWRRLAFVDASGVGASTLTVLAGRRPHLGSGGDGRDGDLAALVGVAGPFPAADGWCPPDLPVVSTSAAGVDRWAAAAAFAPDETSLALLLLDRRWPAGRGPGQPAPLTVLADGRTVVGDVTRSDDGTLGRPSIDGRFARVRVLDGPPAVRRIGPPRPTTRSTLAEWVRLGPAPTGGGRPRRILLVSGQPHLARVARIADDLDVAGSLGADVEVAGPAAPERVSGALVLRELVEAGP